MYKKQGRIQWDAPYPALPTPSILTCVALFFNQYFFYDFLPLQLVKIFWDLDQTLSFKIHDLIPVQFHNNAYST